MASPVFLEVLKDLQGAIEKVDQVKQISKDRDLKNHLTMVGDGVGVLGWVTMDSKPGDVAAELFGGAQMYGNKVLKEYKETYVFQIRLAGDEVLTGITEIALTSNGYNRSTGSSSLSSSTSRTTTPRVYSGTRTVLTPPKLFVKSSQEVPTASRQRPLPVVLRRHRRRRLFLTSITFLRLRRVQHQLVRKLLRTWAQCSTNLTRARRSRLVCGRLMLAK